MTDWWYSYDPWEKFIRTAEFERQGLTVCECSEGELRRNEGLRRLTDVHSRLSELLKLLGRVSLRSDGGDDRGLRKEEGGEEESLSCELGG